MSTFFDLLGDRSGYLAVAFGYDGYRNERGRFTHKTWTEHRYAWPDGADELRADLSKMIAAGERFDAYVCPAVRHTDDRRKGSALPPTLLWADLDDAPADTAVWDTLEPAVVASGSDGHRHAYVPLSRSVDLGTHARLNKALADRLGADHKWSDESLLRLPGTRNFKTDPPIAVQIVRPSSRVWDPEDIADLLGVDLTVDESGHGRGHSPAVEAESVDLDTLPEVVRKRLDADAPVDASGAFHGLVGACRDSGLTQGQAVTVAASWRHTPDRYGHRLAEEIARCWGKLTPSVTDLARGRVDPGEDPAARADPRRYLDKNDGLRAATFANDIIGRGPLAEGIDGVMWSYHGGVWSPDKNVVRTRAALLLGERYRRSHGTNVEDVVRALSPTIACDPVTETINFANGLLRWRTGELIDHTPEVPSTVQLPVTWDPDATCPEFDKFLTEVVPPDLVTVVWELIGYLMFSGNPLHKAVMLMGAGRNGKGTWLRVVGALLGTHNVTSASLHDLVNTRFTTASLFGKIANIAGDIDGTYLENTAMFKAVTGQDSISAEHKGRDRFDFTPWAVPVFSANKIPPSADTTTGYLSRWLVLPFPHDFTGREDRTLDDRLQTPAELSGIAAKAIPALRALLDRGDFALPESGLEARDEFTRRVDQVRTWIDECAEVDANLPFVTRNPLYKAYKAWAVRDGHKPVKAGEFYDRLAAAGVEATRRGAGERGFVGIKVSDHAEDNPWTI